MLAADVTRGVVVGVIAVLSVTGSLRLWHLMALAALNGVGTAFFDPAFDAIVPEILSKESLAQANSLDQFVRPIALRLAGPALGGLLIAGVGVGAAFGLDAATFVSSAAALLAMAARGPCEQVLGAPHGSVVREIGAGLS
jgi:DHA3 family tetracycline resistance protein-like MFS transporter